MKYKIFDVKNEYEFSAFYSEICQFDNYLF